MLVWLAGSCDSLRLPSTVKRGRYLPCETGHGQTGGVGRQNLQRSKTRVEIKMRVYLDQSSLSGRTAGQTKGSMCVGAGPMFFEGKV